MFENVDRRWTDSGELKISIIDVCLGKLVLFEREAIFRHDSDFWFVNGYNFLILCKNQICIKMCAIINLLIS